MELSSNTVVVNVHGPIPQGVLSLQLHEATPIYGHKTMCYTHIWSHAHILYPYMVIRPPLSLQLHEATPAALPLACPAPPVVVSLVVGQTRLHNDHDLYPYMVI